jgi:predicted RNase H-like HicB family nuclease
MNESFSAENKDVLVTVEEAENNLKELMKAVSESAFSLSKYEGRESEADFGFKDDHEQNKEAARIAFEVYLKAVEEKGEAAGVAANQSNLPLN